MAKDDAPKPDATKVGPAAADGVEPKKPEPEVRPSMTAQTTSPPGSALAIFPDDATVPMFIPKPVLLTVTTKQHGHVSMKIPAGMQQIPVTIADHPYLLAHGAKRQDAN